MEQKQAVKIKEVLCGNSYPGRGIIVGNSPDGTKAVMAYFIMGRSANPRNRVLIWEDEELSTAPFDESKVEDPSLIIYTALRSVGDHIIVSNGDQTDTICDGLRKGVGFYESLESRTFEPDAPNFTPRISADLNLESGFRYGISILKSKDDDGTECLRCGWDYDAEPGMGHFIHTYAHDGNPLPSFEGEPVCIEVSDDIDEFAKEIWDSLDEENKISLFVRYIDLANGEAKNSLINKYSAD
jgi:hypothetical protein